MLYPDAKMVNDGPPVRPKRMSWPFLQDALLKGAYRLVFRCTSQYTGQWKKEVGRNDQKHDQHCSSHHTPT